MVQLIELGNRNLLKVLLFFTRNPCIKLTYTNLRKKIKIAKATLTKNLNFLLKAGLIKVETIGLNKLYQINKEKVLVKQIKIIDTLFLLRDIGSLCEKYSIEIYLYGSSSRGEDTEESDIDLLIIGKVSKEEIYGNIQNISKQTGREIKISIFTQLEWAKMSKSDPAFYERIEKDKIRLC